MTLQEVVARFNTTPFLFAGSGITRRYYGLPDWVGLLTYFAGKVKKDSFAYRFYENKASEAEHTAEKLPLVASYVEKDFNDAWFNNEEGIRSDSEKVHNAVSAGVSPFKAEISEYITSLSTVDPVYAEEVENSETLQKVIYPVLLQQIMIAFSRIFLKVIKLLWDRMNWYFHSCRELQKFIKFMVLYKIQNLLSLTKRTIRSFMTKANILRQN